MPIIKTSEEILHGGIYWVSFSPSVGHEYYGGRPAVVIQGDKALRKSSLVTVVPLTSRLDKKHADDILVKVDEGNRLYTDSLIKVHNIESFDRSRFGKRIGIVSKETEIEIKRYLKTHFDLT